MDVTYVDKFRPCVRFVREMCKTLGIESEIKVVQGDVKRVISDLSEKFDYIFAGPPYPLPWLDSIPGLIRTNNLLTEAGLFVLEHNPNHSFEEEEGFLESRKYGQTIFSFFTGE